MRHQLQTGKISDDEAQEDQKIRGMSKPIEIDMGVDDVRNYISEVAADLGRTRDNRTHVNSSRPMLKLLAQSERKLTDNYGVSRKADDE